MMNIANIVCFSSVFPHLANISMGMGGVMVTTAREQDSEKLAESKSQFMLVAVLVIVYCLTICHLC